MALAKAKDALDVSAFPPGKVKRSRRHVCLACIFDIFTRQLKLAPRTAYLEIRKHVPSVEELTGGKPARPYFDAEGRFPRCPYCDATKGKLALFEVIRIDANRSTIAERKKLLGALPKAEGLFEVVETKTTRQSVLFQWLDELGRRFDFDSSGWQMDVARVYLERLDTKTDWAAVFDGVRQVRRSRRLEEGWERQGDRLYLAPALYDEVLLVQYFVSRSHKSGGETFEGRLTLRDLMRRLRYSGFLDEHEIEGEDPLEVLEKLVEALDPGGSSVKLLYVIDRRDFLAKTKSVYERYA